MVELGSGSKRSFPSYTLSRYACYLIAMEADGSKPEVALAKAYFAIQTRKQEISEQYLEDKKSFISENKYLSITNPLQKLQNKLEYPIMEVL
jgi:DNA-damage-inducible protein D